MISNRNRQTAYGLFCCFPLLNHLAFNYFKLEVKWKVGARIQCVSVKEQTAHMHMLEHCIAGLGATTPMIPDKQKMFDYIILMEIFQACWTCGKPPRSLSLWNIYTGKLILSVGSDAAANCTAVLASHIGVPSNHVPSQETFASSNENYTLFNSFLPFWQDIKTKLMQVLKRSLLHLDKFTRNNE